MDINFNPITITGLNEGDSGPSEKGGALMRIVLNLSLSAPSGWSECFNALWKQHLYGAKRSARASGQQISIDCVPSELGAEHLPELKKIVGETNSAYSKHITEQILAEKLKTDKRAFDAAVLADLKKNLNFD